MDGIFPPIPTPFGADGSLALDDLQQLITRLSPQVDGFLVLGSNGEAAFLSEAERDEVLRAARAAIPRGQPLLAGTGGEATREVIARCRRAAEIGADAALVLPPHYYRSQMTPAVLAAHFRAVADASPIPVMLYNVPAATTLALSPELIQELSSHPNITGLKDSSGNIGALTATMRLVPERFEVFTGNAPTMLAAIALGAVGGILAVANVAAAGYRELLEHAHAGRLSAARELQLRLNPLAVAVTSGYGVPGLKAAMRLQGLPAGYPRAPLQPVGPEVERHLAELLETVTAGV